jgi:hypothetical protein
MFSVRPALTNNTTGFSVLGRAKAIKRDSGNIRDSKDLVVSPRWVLYSKTDWPTEPSVVT